MKNLFFLFLTMAVLCHSKESFSHEGHHKVESAPAVLDESIFNLKSKWDDQDGNSIELKELDGTPAFISMVFTSCESACPLTVEDMKRIENELPEKTRSQFRFYLFSFDTQRDTPQKLKAFMQKRKLDEKNWKLFHGSEKSVRDLAAILGIRYKKNTRGDFDHSNIISLISSKGLIQHQQQGLNQDPKPILDKALSESK